MAFMNTPVTHGSGVMMVTGTGANTAVGNISGMLKSTPHLKTPLTKQLDTLTLWIAAAAGLTIAVMFALGISRGQSTQTIFTTAIALALAAVPMAMPTVLQVILSSGSRDLAAHGAVVKSLDSVETLGSTSAINSDKTGTLTMNQVTVVEVIDPTDRYTITGIGYGLDGEVHHSAGNTNTIEAAILPFLITNDAKLVNGKVVGDPTEGALLVLGHKVQLDIEGTQEAHPRLATLPFDPTYKLMAAFCDAKDESGNPVVRVFVKGAAPAVIGRATSALAKGETVPWGEQLNQRADQAMKRLGSKGLRIMAAAMKDIDPTGFDPEGDLLSMIQGLQMTALVGMMDPPRTESLDAVRSAQDANIRVRMVTGDDVVTGAAIAKQLGIPGEAILGTELAAMSHAERLDRIDAIGVVGRVAPEHKALMVETLREKGDVVAMTGDGVNDAPAIKAADIGIAMGTGTQVAKNAGRMILTDDNFATIVRAVSEGRKLYDNMLKYIRFMLVALVTYVVTFLMASLLNIAGGQPFSAVQILWINFLITAPVGIALGLDKETPGLMSRQPRPRAASIMTPAVITTVALAGLFMSVAINLLIVFGKNEYDNVADRQHHGPGGVLPDARRRGVRVPRREGLDPAPGDLRQQHPQHHGPGGDHPGHPDRQGRLPAVPARDLLPFRREVVDRSRSRPGALHRLGARQGDSPSPGRQRQGSRAAGEGDAGRVPGRGVGVWELGKAIARRRENSAAKATLRATAMPVEPAGAV